MLLHLFILVFIFIDLIHFKNCIIVVKAVESKDEFILCNEAKAFYSIGLKSL